MFGSRGTSGDEANGTDDEKDSGPAIEAKVLMQPEAAEQGDDDISECGCRHDEGEIGPGERGHIAREEADEEDDPGDDVGVGEGVKEQAEVVEVDGAHLGHASGEKGVSDGGCEHDGEKDGVLGGL